MRLNMFWPDWQSCGGDRRVAIGASFLKDHLVSPSADELRFYDVPVLDRGDFQETKSIFARDLILEQMASASGILKSSQPSKILVIAGTCGAEIVPVSYLNHLLKGNLTVVWFDAHGDLNTPVSSPSKHFHGMPLRTLLGEGDTDIVNGMFSELLPSQIVLAGVRELDDEESQFIESHSIRTLSVDDLANPEQLRDAIDATGHDNIYIHFDFDVLDPVANPCALMPTPHAVSFTHVVDSLRHALIGGKSTEGKSLVGFSLLEFAAPSEKNLHIARQLFDVLSSALDRE